MSNEITEIESTDEIELTDVELDQVSGAAGTHHWGHGFGRFGFGRFGFGRFGFGGFGFGSPFGYGFGAPVVQPVVVSQQPTQVVVEQPQTQLYALVPVQG